MYVAVSSTEISGKAFNNFGISNYSMIGIVFLEVQLHLDKKNY
jgi:hypothetical protein